MNLQTTENSPLKMVPKAMVVLGTRDAPKFLLQKPQKLRRFIQLMEDLWKDAGITDKEKKASLGKHADQDCKEEWEGLEIFEKGNSWEIFEKELMENYPEAAATDWGMLARIKHLCNKAKGIQLGDLATLYAF